MNDKDIAKLQDIRNKKSQIEKDLKEELANNANLKEDLDQLHRSMKDSEEKSKSIHEEDQRKISDLQDQLKQSEIPETMRDKHQSMHKTRISLTKMPWLPYRIVKNS